NPQQTDRFLDNKMEGRTAEMGASLTRLRPVSSARYVSRTRRRELPWANLALQIRNAAPEPPPYFPTCGRGFREWRCQYGATKWCDCCLSGLAEPRARTRTHQGRRRISHLFPMHL